MAMLSFSSLVLSCNPRALVDLLWVGASKGHFQCQEIRAVRETGTSKWHKPEEEACFAILIKEVTLSPRPVQSPNRYGTIRSTQVSFSTQWNLCSGCPLSAPQFY